MARYLGVEVRHCLLSTSCPTLSHQTTRTSIISVILKRCTNRNPLILFNNCLERARSISPQKSSPANTPPPPTINRGSAAVSSRTRLESPVQKGFDSREASREASVDPDITADSTQDLSMATSTAESPKENTSPLDSDSKGTGATTPTGRSSTLSWQRRPPSRGGPGNRPLSIVAAQNATQRSLAGSQEQPSSASADEDTFSKDQIAQALGSKDPSWFRQTADRGVGNAAYRKNQVEDADRSDVNSASAQLPGMSRPISDQGSQNRSTGTTSPGQRGLAAPLPLNPPQAFDGPEELPPREQPSNGQTSPTRSTSPTKGMGGFVQSAMMKRSDSVKRWSVTNPHGLARADSVVSNRPPTSTRPQSIYRGAARAQVETRQESETEAEDKVDNSVASIDTTVVSQKEDASLPSSPTKTMDPRRWSPTKSSWLESALNKPESPKPQPKPYNSAQPAWMVELNKSKAERASNPSVEPSKPAVSHKHQVSIGGLQRPSPMGSSSKSDAPALGGIYSPPVRSTGSSPTRGGQSFVRNPRASAKAEDLNPASEETQERSDEAEPQEARPAAASSASKPQVKPKPQTPPKTDFRANLKQRVPDPGSKKDNEPEFRNALGNLRRAQTQNYVAPDELKDNITRGKAGLSVTGGPQKTVIKDEFKDAILQKTGDFKAIRSEGRGIVRNPTSASNQIPEGLAKRAQLGRQKTGPQEGDAISSIQVNNASESAPAPSSKRVPSETRQSPTASRSTKPNLPAPTMEQIRRVSTEPSEAKTPAESKAPPVLKKETSVPTNFPSRTAGGGLANRFNPALASMLARGPPPGTRENADSSEARRPVESKETSEPTSAGPQLTHMTKSRARGPKRKAPTAAAAAAAPATKRSEEVKPKAASPRPTPKSPPVTTSSRGIRDKPASPKLNPNSPTIASSSRGLMDKSLESSGPTAKLGGLPIRQQVAASAALKSRPAADSSFGSSERGRSAALDQPAPLNIKRVVREPSPLKTQKTGDASPEPGSPKKLNMNRMSRFLDQGATPSENLPREPIALTRQRTGSPVKISSGRPLPDPVSAPRPLPDPVSAPRPLPDPISTSRPKVEMEPTKTPVKTPVKPSNLTDIATKSPPVGPKPTSHQSSPRQAAAKTPLGSRPLPTPTKATASSARVAGSPVRSPAKQSSEISVILHDFFGPQQPYQQTEIDPTEILAKRPDSFAKINSKSARVFLFSAEGRKTPVADQFERVLFAGDMYICSHEYINEAGWKRSEVYFWVGDDVPESAAEDATLFAAKEAKFLGGKLIKISQGKETSEFLQALGGVVIIRRGSTNKYDSLAPSMLCGRRFQGQVVFDEVDVLPSSLCAGFPYLIMQGGKCCLWKGKGSDAEEISAARLVGMELAMSGEMAEYEDGKEPDSFWTLFSGGSKPHSADHWRLKPSYSKYSGRLFCSDAESKQQVRSIISSPLPNGINTNTVQHRFLRSLHSAKPIFHQPVSTLSMHSSKCMWLLGIVLNLSTLLSATLSHLLKNTRFSHRQLRTGRSFRLRLLYLRVSLGT